MTDREKTIGVELRRTVQRLTALDLRLLLAYGQGLADGSAVRDQPGRGDDGA